ncbi:Zn-dependent protease (includes SpoIVFB) [Arenibacter nanhaiticus]|uniref:Zinc metalloprotease n=1 Tax=Arenibacter nanhaiticus TaxID=558155 RepID=A0A1M6JBV1_9FLAO|nr:site-2 protease family protein [Arenibacter nanhaiticus]SHJ44117.1 Zn-dependent protease (includes SpoIVFB) [Arenibacter nanhaiticus]
MAGIKIEVHWTFSLLLLWVVFLDSQRGGNLLSALFNIGFVLVLFFCVVLHELGHALTARKFQIKTHQITLLPIGGVASLEKMPEKPGQELLVALAGPAVNVVIALLLILLFPITKYLSMDQAGIELLLKTPNFQGFIFYLFLANAMLVLFNLIPAFPMDGGRVLRALLAYKMGRVKATAIASSLGQLLAVFFFMLGVLINPFLILIAFFIFISAYGENKMVKQTSLLQGHTIKEAMLTKITLLHPDNTLQEVIDVVLAGTEKDFVVMAHEKIVGVVYHKDIIKHAHTPSIKVKEIMQASFKTLEASTDLVQVMEMIASEKRNFFPVTDKNKFSGAIDLTNISEFILLRTHAS